MPIVTDHTSWALVAAHVAEGGRVAGSCWSRGIDRDTLAGLALFVGCADRWITSAGVVDALSSLAEQASRTGVLVGAKQALIGDAMQAFGGAVGFLGTFFLFDTAVVDAEVIRGTTWGTGVRVVDTLVVGTNGTCCLAVAGLDTNDTLSLVTFVGAITFRVLRTTPAGIETFFDTDPRTSTLWSFTGLLGLAIQTRIVSAAELRPRATSLAGIGVNIGMKRVLKQD